MMRPTPTSQHRRWTAITHLLVVALVAVTLGVSSAAAPTARAAAAEITTGSMTWGVKASWRGYAGQGTLSGGVTTAAGGAYQFPLAGGTFDPETGATDLQFAGTVHWQSHYYPNETAVIGPPPDGYSGPTDIYLLDVTLSDPAVRITGAGAEITVELVSRSLSTWQVVDYGRVPIATLDVSGIEPAVDAGQTTWSNIPVAWAQAGVDAIGYTIGQIVDPLSFTYTGDGGVPIVSEAWTPPGTIAVELAGNTLFGDELSTSVLWIDQTDSVAHYTTLGDAVTFTAFDLATLSPIGTPLTVDGAEAGQIGSGLFTDPNRNRLYYKSSFDDGALIDSYLEWDPVSATYRIGHDVSLDVGYASLYWDVAHSRLFALDWTMPPGAASPDEREWHLDTYTQGADGQFTHATYTLPPAPAGLDPYGSWYSLTGATALADGSLLLVRQQVRAADLSAPDMETLAQHVTLSGTTVTVTEIAGTDAGNQEWNGYKQVHAAGDTAYLVRPAWFNVPGLVQQLHVGDGAVTLAGPAVGLDGVVAESFAVDPTDATLWGLSGTGQTLIAVADGRVVARHLSPYISQTRAAITVGADHRVYAASSDGQLREFGENNPLGFAAFARAGVSPTVTASPSAVEVVVEPAASTPVTFTAAATGDPAPTVRWQQRAPGDVTFTDLADANEPTLSVDATPALANTAYRAVFTNAAGSIATEPATLDVHYAPIITTQPISTTVDAGADATFQVHSTASPEPTIAWQRLVDGAWVDLAAGSDHYSGESTGTLTISSVAPADTATTYRATITNTIGTVASEQATLTVTTGGDGDQEIVVDVPEPGAGEFAWEIPGASRDVALGAATDAGDHWAATGSILPITVADTRANGPAWSLSGQVSDFGPVSGRYLGWTPQLISAGGGAQAGAAVPSGLASGEGLAAAAVLAEAPAGHAAGTATVGAALDLRLPRNTPPGTYTATLTITALS